MPPPPAGGRAASRGKVALAAQHQRERAILLSYLDKSCQPAADKTRVPSGTAPAMPSSVNHTERLSQRSAKKPPRQPDFASVATAIALTLANIDAIFIPALSPIQEKDTDKGEEHGTNSLGGGVAEETNFVYAPNKVALAEVDTELGDLVHLPSMFDGKR